MARNLRNLCDGRPPRHKTKRGPVSASSERGGERGETVAETLAIFRPSNCLFWARKKKGKKFWMSFQEEMAPARPIPGRVSKVKKKEGKNALHPAFYREGEERKRPNSNGGRRHDGLGTSVQGKKKRITVAIGDCCITRGKEKEKKKFKGFSVVRLHRWRSGGGKGGGGRENISTLLIRTERKEI